MKKHILPIAFLIIFSLFHFYGYSQCTNVWSGGTANAPTSSSTTTISTCTWQDEYNVINNIVAGNTYTIGNSCGGFITVRSGTYNGPVVATGNAPLTFTATVSGTYYIHYNTNSSCGTAWNCCTTTITCTSCGSPPPPSGCTNIWSGGTANAPTSSSTTTISTCTWQDEYDVLNNVVAGNTYTIGSSCGGFITVRSGTYNGPVVATGNAPLTFTATVNGTHYIHYNTNSSCGTAMNCCTTTITCTSCGGSTPVTAGDCTNAINVCTNLNFSIDPNGFGNVNELCSGCFSNPSTNPASTNFGCLLSGELNSTWMVVNIATTGTLQFSFGTLNTTSFNCYDWIMWPYNSNTCNQILNNTIAPIRCNWNSPCEEFTGISSTPPAGGSASNFEPNLNVTAGQQFIICFSNYSSTTTSVPLNFFGTASVSCTPLPIVLLDFSASCENNASKITWTTATEINNDYFELEKSYDAFNFFSVGTIKGNGNSHQFKEYTYRDYETSDKTVYYRLKQVDFNGNFEYFDIIPSQCFFEGNFNVSNTRFENNLFQFNINTPSDEKINIYLYDYKGSIVHSETKFVNKGNSNITLNNLYLANGIYMLNIMGEKNYYSSKISKQ